VRAVGLLHARSVTRLFDVAIAWTLLAVFGTLARAGRGPARSLLLRALRQASRAPSRRRGERPPPWALVAAFQTAAAGHRLAHSCVPRALALHRLLVLRGGDARVRLGLGAGRPLDGHAWVESGGRPVGETPAVVARYRPCETS
jgi:hypothetical protein